MSSQRVHIRSKNLSLLFPMSPRHNHSLQRVHILSRFHSCLRSCMHPYLQPASRPPYLDMPPHRYTCGVPPELHASTSRHLHRTSRPPDLHTSTLSRLNASSVLPDLQSCMPHGATPAARSRHHQQRSSRAQYLRSSSFRTPSARLQHSIPLYLHACTPVARL